jgi:excisionase family DNA binding protein
MTTPEPPLTTEEFAAQVRRDPQSVRRWVKKGTIIGRNVGGRVLIPRAELERFASGKALPKPGPKPGQKRHATNRQNAYKS